MSLIKNFQKSLVIMVSHDQNYKKYADYIEILVSGDKHYFKNIHTTEKSNLPISKTA